LSKIELSSSHDRPRHLRQDPVVFDALPQTVPINVRELEVIESYLGQFVDEVLAAKTEEPTPSCVMPLRGRLLRS
jgi:hypothetical protein